MRIQRHELARLLSAVTKAVPSRNTLPIIATVRLVTDGGKLTATATDLDIEISGSINCEGTLSACIDAKLLSAAVSKAGGDDLTFEQDGNTVTMKAGRSRYKLPSLPVDDFPTMAVGAFDAEFEIDAAGLFGPVAFAISTEETRYYLNGVYIHNTDAGLVAVATDGHRLARHTVPTVGDIPAVIVPRKTVGIVPKGALTVKLSQAKIQFVAADVTITSKLIDGSFPDYDRVIPKNNDKRITFTGDDVVKAANRVAVVANDRAPGAKLSIDGSEINMSLHGEGEADDVVACDYGGEPIEIGFNASYLAELVGQFPAGDVTMALLDGGSPAVFTSKAAESLLCVLMPRRV